MVVSSEASSLILVDAHPGGSHSPMDSGRFVGAAPIRWFTASALAPDSSRLIGTDNTLDPTGRSVSARAMPYTRRADPDQPPPAPNRRADPHQCPACRMPDGPILLITRHPLDPRCRREVLHCAALLPVAIYSPFHWAASLVRTQAPDDAANATHALGIARARPFGTGGSDGV